MVDDLFYNNDYGDQYGWSNGDQWLYNGDQLLFFPWEGISG